MHRYHRHGCLFYLLLWPILIPFYIIKYGLIAAAYILSALGPFLLIIIGIGVVIGILGAIFSAAVSILVPVILVLIILAVISAIVGDDKSDKTGGV